MVIKSRRMRWTGYIAHIGQVRNLFKILIRKPKRKRPLGRSRHKWEDIIQMDLREIRWEVVDWMHLAKGR
jgi:hypothetical protein